MISFHEMGGEGAALFAELHRLSFENDQAQIWTQKDFTQLCTVGGTSGFIIGDAEEPFGFVLVRLLGEEAEILTLCLHPDRQRRGYATLLLDHLGEQLKMRGAKRLFLDVRVDNEAATGLYEKSAFEKSGVRKNYYSLADGGKKDACLMARNL